MVKNNSGFKIKSLKFGETFKAKFNYWSLWNDQKLK